MFLLMLPVFFDHYTDFVQCGEWGIALTPLQLANSKYRLNAYVNKKVIIYTHLTSISYYLSVSKK